MCCRLNGHHGRAACFGTHRSPDDRPPKEAMTCNAIKGLNAQAAIVKRFLPGRHARAARKPAAMLILSCSRILQGICTYSAPLTHNHGRKAGKKPKKQKFKLNFPPILPNPIHTPAQGTVLERTDYPAGRPWTLQTGMTAAFFRSGLYIR